MKLFYQLTHAEQNEALNHCADIVIQDMIEDGVFLDPLTSEEAELKEHIDKALKHTTLLELNEDKEDYLMSDPIVSKAIYDIALEMAKSAFYHDDEEMVIFSSSLTGKPEHEPEREKLLMQPNTKKASSLN